MFFRQAIGAMLAAMLFSAPCLAQTPEVAEQIDIEPVWAGHSVGFRLLTAEPWQFAAYYNASRQMTIASRQLGDKTFDKQTLDSHLKWDSHNYIDLAVDRQGCLHVSGNMHGVPLVYFRSEKPYDIHSLRALHRMTGQDEKRVTYPQFLHDAQGRLVFMYRDGASGNGRRFFNAYDEATRQWRRLVDTPVFDGTAQSMNAYPGTFHQGEDGLYHVVWMWRDTPDAATNHHISYARTADFQHWENAAGKALNLPITPLDENTHVDPVGPRKGLINMSFGVGLDTQRRPVVTYHKYDPQGMSQVYAARWEGERWNIRPLTDWKWRWEFGGGGSIPSMVGASGVRVLDDGRLIVHLHNRKLGGGAYELDPETLDLRDKVSLPPAYPGGIRRLESDFPGMGARLTHDKGRSHEEARAAGKTAFFLKWETLGSNRDRPRQPPLPDPSMLRLYGVRYR